jgi:hypothetical protein
MTPIQNLSSSYLQSILAVSNPASGSTANSNNAGSISPTQPDSSRLSPFAQLMSTLQQLQQSDPSKYQQLTQQIPANLQSASQTAQANGNATAATQLSQLSTDFSNTSKSGQLPNVQDLAQAMSMHGHGGHHHHHVHATSAESETGSASGGDSSSANQGITQVLAALQSNEANNSLNPFDIIQSTLQQSGVIGA